MITSEEALLIIKLKQTEIDKLMIVYRSNRASFDERYGAAIDVALRIGYIDGIQYALGIEDQQKVQDENI
jgi:hypothetical protein